MKRLLTHLLKAFIKLYQYGISPILPGTCRYTPTCSAYSLEALERFGPFKGTWLGLKRIARCHPWGGSGFDPVPKGKDETIKNETSRF